MGNTDKDLQNNEDRRYKVYVYTNKVNGKKYMGQTNKSLIRRAHKDGSGYSSCPIFSNAIKKYGWNNFEPRIAFDDLTHEEANRIEKYLIKILRTQDRNYGYNMGDGGTGGNNYKTCPVNQYDLDGNFIAHYDSQMEAAEKIGCSLRGIRTACDKHWSIYGYLVRFDSEPAPEPYVKQTQQSILQFSLNGKLVNKFLSIARASKETEIKTNNLYRALSSKSKSHCFKDFIWVYEDVYAVKGQSYINSLIENSKHSKGEKSIYQLDKNNNILNEFKSIKEAAEFVHRNYTSISDVIHGRSHTCAGYVWILKEDYDAQYEKEAA